MTEEIFSLILKIATYDGDTEYANYEEMTLDEKNAGGIAMKAIDVKRVAYVAYQLGKLEGQRECNL